VQLGLKVTEKFVVQMTI